MCIIFLHSSCDLVSHFCVDYKFLVEVRYVAIFIQKLQCFIPKKVLSKHLSVSLSKLAKRRPLFPPLLLFFHFSS